VKLTEAVVKDKTRVIDLDLRAYFDTVKHHILLNKIAERIADDKVMWLLKLMLKHEEKKAFHKGVQSRHC